MAKKPVIKVHIKVVGFVEKKMVAAEFDLEVPQGTTLKKLFSRADKSGKLESRVIKKIMAMPRPPTVLVNGSNIDVPKGLAMKIEAGDEVAILTPVGGG